MAIDERKRALPPKVAAMKARKRQKIDALNSQGTGTEDISKRRRITNFNSLNFKDGPMPDRLDDCEGLIGGIEEIDGIDVVRDESTGKNSFYVMAESAAVVDEGPSSAADEDDSPEWGGIDDDRDHDHDNDHDNDDDGSGGPPPKSTVKAEAKPKSRDPTASKPKSKSKQEARSTRGSGVANGAFAALSEHDEAEGVDVSAWRELKLSPDTLASLSRLRFSSPTAIQRAVIPEALAGHDVIGKASTGSGKTLAFGIPILERFLETRARHGERRPDGDAAPLALILSPTRELAHQLHKHVAALCSGLLSGEPAIATLTGGLSVQKQQRLLKEADVIIGTPGRLWEVISEGRGVGAALKRIQFLVIDEADRLLSEGHFKEVEDILNTLDRVDRDETAGEDVAGAARGDDELDSPTDRQTLVFSATFDQGLQKKLVGKSRRRDNLLSNKESLEYLLARLNFREESPRFLDVNPVNQLASGLKEGLVECGATEKDLYLYALLLLHPHLRTLVFTNSISAVRRVTPLLQNLSLPVLALHSGMPQKARLRSVERFSQPPSSSSSLSPGSPRPQASTLIATDVAARGLDISNVQLVIHYHLPRAADTYVHRSGRTARAGARGASILLCAPEEVAGVRKLVAQVHARSADSRPPGAAAAAAKSFFIRTLDIDRRLVSRLKERVVLAKTLADAVIAKQKAHKEEDFLRQAAEDLGVGYESDELEAGGGSKGKRGRGGGRKKREREARGLGKGEAEAMRAELKGLLRQRVNVGVSERYLTAGRVDVDELLRQQDAGVGKTGEFLGAVGDLGLED